MKKLIGLMSILAIGSSAYAGCTSTGCKGVKIDRLYLTGNGNVFVRTTGNQSALNCTLSSGAYMTLPVNSAGTKAIYSAFLTAQVTKKDVLLESKKDRVIVKSFIQQ